jgi:hypothetical protein
LTKNKEGKVYLLLDRVPDNAGHFITIEINNGVGDLNASILGV